MVFGSHERILMLDGDYIHVSIVVVCILRADISPFSLFWLLPLVALFFVLLSKDILAASDLEV